MSARRWWLLGGLRGGMSQHYHYLNGYESACGQSAPGRFIACADSEADKRRKRCPECVKALAIERERSGR